MFRRRFGRSKSGAKPTLSNGEGNKKRHRTATRHAQNAKRVIDPAHWFSLLRVPLRMEIPADPEKSSFAGEVGDD
jgi:hypothetical protein